MPRRNRGWHVWYSKKDDKYYLRIFEGGKARTESTGARTDEEAEIFLAKKILAQDVCGGGPVEPAQRIVGDSLLAYSLERAPQTDDPARIANAIEALMPFWGELTLQDITKGTIKKYIDQRYYRRTKRIKRQEATGDKEAVWEVQEYGPLIKVKASTCARELSALKAAIQWDFDEGRITRVVPVKVPSGFEPKMRVLTRSEIAAMIREARKHHHKRHLVLFILMSYYTAARKEQILSLQWWQIQNGRIDFNNRDVQNSKRRPTIPVHRRLARFLEYQMKRTGSDEDGRIEFKHVIQYNGKPIRDIRLSFVRNAKAAGLDGVTPHTMRHTSASHMAMKNVNMQKISQFLGHRRVATTEEVYAKFQPGYLDEALEAFD